MHFLLVPGLWLDGESWAPVTTRLIGAGHRVTAITLPGMSSAEDDRSGITLDDHLAAVVAAIDEGHRPVIVVGHSASATLALAAADARPETVTRVVYLGGFPAAEGQPFMAGLAAEGAGVPFPGWAAFDGPDSADIDDDLKRALVARFIPSPAGVLAGVVHYTDKRRHAIPATEICPEFSVADFQSWVTGGDVPELAATTILDAIEFDSGHWPQFTAPERLAEVIAALAER